MKNVKLIGLSLAVTASLAGCGGSNSHDIYAPVSGPHKANGNILSAAFDASSYSGVEMAEDYNGVYIVAERGAGTFSEEANDVAKEGEYAQGKTTLARILEIGPEQDPAASLLVAYPCFSQFSPGGVEPEEYARQEDGSYVFTAETGDKVEGVCEQGTTCKMQTKTLMLAESMLAGSYTSVTEEASHTDIFNFEAQGSVQKVSNDVELDVAIISSTVAVSATIEGFPIAKQVLASCFTLASEGSVANVVDSSEEVAEQYSEVFRSNELLITNFMELPFGPDSDLALAGVFDEETTRSNNKNNKDKGIAYVNYMFGPITFTETEANYGDVGSSDSVTINAFGIENGVLTIEASGMDDDGNELHLNISLDPSLIVPTVPLMEFEGPCCEDI